MKKLLLTAIILFAFIMLSQAQNSFKPAIKCNYLLYLPTDYHDNTKEYPLVIFLHGSNLRGNDINMVKKSSLPYYISQGKHYDFIVASPQCPENYKWSLVNWFDSLYTDLSAKYRIDKSRIYATGNSMGGFGTWQVAMDYPDKIAAIVPLCGGCLDSLEICKIKKMPIWAFHGVNDDVVDVNQTDRLVQRLNKCDANIKYTRIEGRGHGISDFYQKDEIFDWLLQQKLAK